MLHDSTYVISRLGKLIEIEGRLEITGDSGRAESKELLLNGYKVSPWLTNKVWTLVIVVNVIDAAELCTWLKWRLLCSVFYHNKNKAHGK